MTDGPVLRVFEVRTKQGCADKLLENFATTSADVVRDKPGNRGYFYGRCVQGGENAVLFVSVWNDLDAVKTQFGEDWQSEPRRVCRRLQTLRSWSHDKDIDTLFT